jgi:methyl-accepting chemotaxis protein
LRHGIGSPLKDAEPIIAELEQALGLGLQNENTSAMGLLTVVDPKIADLTSRIRAATEASSEETQREAVALERETVATEWLDAGLGLLGIGLGLGFGVWMGRTQISRPLAQIAGQMKTLAGGDLSVDVDGQNRGDEVGAMAKAVQIFKDNGIRARSLEAESAQARSAADAERLKNEADRHQKEAELAEVVQVLAISLNQLADGNLASRIEARFSGQYAQIQEDFNRAVSSLSDAMLQISESSGSIQSGSEEISQASDDMARRSEQQAASLEETAAALDEITATVRRSADGARIASEAVAHARKEADTSREVMARAIQAMTEIQDSSSKISNIIGVIDEIAFQTNLLALNAGVEAARAGDAGRGFAVVAQEVRALAQRSADAAREIKILIGNSSGQVRVGVDLVGSTGEALNSIVDRIGSIDSSINEIARSAQEQSTGLSQVNIAVNQMDQVTQQTTAMVEETNAASGGLRAEARDLNQLVSKFRIGGSGAARRERFVA